MTDRTDPLTLHAPPADSVPPGANVAAQRSSLWSLLRAAAHRARVDAARLEQLAAELEAFYDGGGLSAESERELVSLFLRARRSEF